MKEVIMRIFKVFEHIWEQQNEHHKCFVFSDIKKAVDFIASQKDEILSHEHDEGRDPEVNVDILKDSIAEFRAEDDWEETGYSLYIIESDMDTTDIKNNREITAPIAENLLTEYIKEHEYDKHPIWPGMERR